MNKIIKKVLKFILTPLIVIGLIGGGVTRSKQRKNLKINSMYNVDGKSCYKDKEQQSSIKYVSYKACDADFKLEDWVIESKGNKKDVIILDLQGGPASLLETVVKYSTMPRNGQDGANGQDGLDSNEIKRKPYRYKTSFELAQEKSFFGTNAKDYTVGFVKEIFHMKYNLHMNGYKLSIEDAVKEQLEYMDILEKIIKEYKKTYSKVIVFGHSYGAIQVNELLRTKGTIADGFVSAAGRLKMPDNIVNNFKKRTMQLFDKDGIPEKVDFKIKIMSFVFRNFLFSGEMNSVIHAPAIGQRDYTKEINPSKLTHNNIVWISAEYDRQVGNFDDKEKAFAKKHGTLIYYDKANVKNTYPKLVKHEPDYAHETYEELGHDIMLFPTEMDKWIKILKI